MSRSALRNRTFTTYLSGVTISLHGLWVYRVTLGWFAWQLTGSELWVGIIAFTQFAPAVILGPLFGVFADRFDSRRGSILINSGSVLNIGTLAVLALAGKADIAVLATTSLIQGMLDGAHTPVRMTLVPSIVTREQLQSAIASNSIAFNLSRFIGPAIAGITIANWGVGTAFAISSVAYLGTVTAVILINRVPVKKRLRAPGNVWAELREGVRYVLRHRSILALLTTVSVASVLGRGALEMLPAFADSVLQGGAGALAALTSAIGIGSIATGLALSRHTAWLSARVVRAALAVAGVLLALFGANDNLAAAVVLVVLLGAALSLVGIGSQVLIQGTVADELRGRVSSLWGMIAFGGTAIGGLGVGGAAALFGLQPTVTVAGIACAALALLSRSRTD